ncbi:MAG: DinB family protein [Anaerolineales bacterium]|nr:DinB family protein [Anaerolineales bacterium]MCB9126407.1 DinB family protein [Ardenticatenales bacterium]MCB9171568.1 DinB family protein [Ardenticatenales bacterium]
MNDHAERWQAALWRQFGAAIDMFANAVTDCPDDLWQKQIYHDPERPELTQFWVVAYHTLYFLDLYLSGTGDGFAPPEPFTTDRLEPDGEMPDQPFSRVQLQGYIDHCRRKCHDTLTALTDERAMAPSAFVRSGRRLSFYELQLYNMRHVQQHEGQLAMVIGQAGHYESLWISVAKSS